MSEFNALLAKNIKRLRKAKSWTQNDLAVDSGISFRGIQDIEIGKRTPRAETLRAIAGSLGVNESQLFTEPEAVQVEQMQTTALAREIVSEMNKIRASKVITQDLDADTRELVSLFDALPAERKDVALDFVRNLLEGVGTDILTSPRSDRRKLR